MKRGFSLVGSLLVVLIIAILLTWLLPQYTQVLRQQQQGQKSTLEQVRKLQADLNQRVRQQQNSYEQLERGNGPKIIKRKTNR